MKKLLVIAIIFPTQKGTVQIHFFLIHFAPSSHTAIIEKQKRSQTISIFFTTRIITVFERKCVSVVVGGAFKYDTYIEHMKKSARAMRNNIFG